MKKILSIIITATLLLSIGITNINAVEPTESVTPAVVQVNNIYANAKEGSSSVQSWQVWQQTEGATSNSGIYYIFLPKCASDTQVELFNSFSDTVVIGGTEISSNSSKVINYTNGKELTVTNKNSNRSYKLEIYKSDSEASIYINDTTGVYTDYNGNTVRTDLFSFLTSNKENYISNAPCTIIDEKGINDFTLKKFKGRGNSTWKDCDKKGFNLNFNDKTSIAGLENKKFSLLANAKDGSLIRNKIMYDFADEVGSEYSSDSRFVDLYINGIFQGSYQVTKKVELGKNSLVSLKDNADTTPDNFNFLVEVDIWNYKSDTYFETTKGLYVVCKTPQLENYDASNPLMAQQFNFMKTKFQQFENALYSGTMSDLEKICDIDSIARAYLLQEFGKNCDGGMTSCYFTYNAETGKFTADPIWDCDSCLGNVNCTRKNATNTANTTGYAIKTAQYDFTRNMTNVLGQAVSKSGTTTNGETMNDVVKRLWNNDFYPAISVLKGETKAKGTRLKSIKEYENICPQSYRLNYIKWGFMWFPYYEDLGGQYNRDYEGQLAYLEKWTEKRATWLNSQLGNNPQTTTTASTTKPTTTVPKETNYYLTGLGFGGWGALDYTLTKDKDGNYYIDVTLKKDTFYKFKIFDGNNVYFTANVEDEETGKYIHLGTSVNKNAEITPTEDMNVRFILQSDGFIMRLRQPKEYLIGDVTGDNMIDISDATAIQKYTVKLIDLSEEQLICGDCNEDGIVSIQDTTMIQKYVVRLITDSKINTVVTK